MSHEPQREEISERRLMLRYPTSSAGRVIRDSDAMRQGTEASLSDVSSASLGIRMKTVLEVNEQIKIQLRNDIQRFDKEVRGRVKHVMLADDGEYHVGIELYQRLTPLEVALLKMGIRDGP